MMNGAVALVLDRSDRVLLIQRDGVLMGIGTGVPDGDGPVTVLAAEIESVTGLHVDREAFYPMVEISHPEGVTAFYRVSVTAEDLNRIMFERPHEYDLLLTPVSTVVRYQRAQNLDWLLALARHQNAGSEPYDTVLVSAR